MCGLKCKSSGFEMSVTPVYNVMCVTKYLFMYAYVDSTTDTRYTYVTLNVCESTINNAYMHVSMHGRTHTWKPYNGSVELCRGIVCL